MFRMQRTIGGSCTEYIHVDEGLHQLATYWALGLSFNTHRICPVCKSGLGTPRHYAMACPEVKTIHRRNIIRRGPRLVRRRRHTYAEETQLREYHDAGTEANYEQLNKKRKQKKKTKTNKHNQNSKHIHKKKNENTT